MKFLPNTPQEAVNLFLFGITPEESRKRLHAAFLKQDFSEVVPSLGPARLSRSVDSVDIEAYAATIAKSRTMRERQASLLTEGLKEQGVKVQEWYSYEFPSPGLGEDGEPQYPGSFYMKPIGG